MSKSDMYTFDCKATFYESRYRQPVTRKIAISPMVDDCARPVAGVLELEIYSYANEVEE